MREGFRVIYDDSANAELARASAPRKKATGQESYPVCALTFSGSWSLPSSEDTAFEGLGLDGNDAELMLGYERLATALLGHAPTPSDARLEQPLHHLLGYPEIIQSDMKLEVQLVTHGLYVGDGSGFRVARAAELRAGAREWTLLLQIDSDDGCPGWMWGDVGRLYFWIRRQDLAARRFSNAWMILQCY